tara:strand:+ start:232 stop:504 length:273 start_codon:yes stop_codon:yes gene_type:complete
MSEAMQNLSIELPDDLHQMLASQAAERGLSVEAFVLYRLRHIDDHRCAPAQVMPGSMQEMLLSRPWQGRRDKADIDAQMTQERRDWSDNP